MKDNRMFENSRMLIGFFSIFISIILIFLGIMFNLIFLIYGVPVLIIGLFILFNKKEDDIEQIKKVK
jgi:hypothetical protein